jgi:Zn-dependent protease with chaperone function
MIAIHGKWFDGRTSAQVHAVFKVYDDGAWQLVHADRGDLLLKQSEFTAHVSSRMANTPRFITFPQGQTLETTDNDGVDAILTMLKRGHWSKAVHQLESRKHYILLAMVFLVAMAFGLARYGAPLTARLIVAYLPQVVFQKGSKEALAILDRLALAPTQLKPETTRRLRNHFQAVMNAHPHLRLAVIFRKGRAMGPNAFALPDGQIVFTDEMVEIAQNDNELLSVLAHEIGHVVHQHGMRRMVEDSLLSFAIMAVTGDAQGVSELFLGLPVVLTELAYSRRFENEADQYAKDYMRLCNIPGHHFGDILMRIQAADKNRKKSDGKKCSNYLSTHPSTQERANFFNDNPRE